jgi:hypothetical protein
VQALGVGKGVAVPHGVPRPPFSFLIAKQRSAAALRPASERVESRLLLVAERRIEILQRRLHGPGRLKHGSTRFSIASSRPTDVCGTKWGQASCRIAIACSVAALRRSSARSLLLVRLHHLLDALDRKIGR